MLRNAAAQQIRAAARDDRIAGTDVVAAILTDDLDPATNGTQMIETGAPAPDFELPDQDGALVKLSDLRGQTVVVYCDPKADTPGR